MADYSQADRIMRVETNLGDDVLLLESLSGEEGLSMPFLLTLGLLSERSDLKADDLLRSEAVIYLELPGGKERPIHGIIRRFVQLGQTENGEFTRYRAEVVPWLWFLSLSADCKIFQEKSVLEIVEQVFKDQGCSDFRIKCVKSYPKREFCVQYRETHLSFVSRLMEEEGVFYFFEHSGSKHTLVLADDGSAVKQCEVQSTARIAPQPSALHEEDIVFSIESEHAAHAGTVTLRDFDYLKPTLNLESSVSGDGTEEVYDYTFPGNLITPNDGDRLARLVLEEREQWRELVRGESTCRSFQSGFHFDLEGHYSRSVNKKYQLVQVRHSAKNGAYHTQQGQAETEYRNSFIAIPHKTPFRPQRVTPKPVVQGSQTAIVVGKSGEEIWVDKHGRVKVQFHWDRDGKKDENSSCWVRVASGWAGRGWGFIQIPRIGQEVIIDFLEGDPDMPLITGRVYNGGMDPPYALPANQTQSGVKSRSSKGGGTDNYNELRFEDKMGEEEILIHAEKDLLIEVENDETHNVEHDRITTITNDETRTVEEGNDAVTITKGKQTLDIKQGDQIVTLGQGDQKVTLNSGNQTLTLKMGNRTVTLDKGGETVRLKMGDQKTQLDMGNQTTDVKMGNVTTKAALGKVSEEAMQGIELKVGQSSVKIDQAGVTIKGMTIKIQGQIATEVKGMMTDIKGDGMLTVKGGITMIN
jgi:type VI secretion system secreted protein VgrG